MHDAHCREGGGRSRRSKRLALAATSLAAAVASAGILSGPTGAQTNDLGLPLNPKWVENTTKRGLAGNKVINNTVDGAIARRNRAVADYKAAKNPDPQSKPQYLLVWSGKANAGDVSGHDLGVFLQNGTINPEGLTQFGSIQFGPGLDAFQVVDGRRLNTDGSQNPDYGRVVNFVQMPLPGGAEGEPHHMQYEWFDGDPVVAGGLFNDWTWVMDVKDIPNMSLKNQILPNETPLGSVPDAYDNTGGGTFIGTYMGGPNFNFAGSPGSLVAFKPDATKGLVMASETPAGKIGGITTGNAGGVPEPCSAREARPLGTCANPHGIQARIDLGTMLTSDYAEPRELTTDPLKPADENTFRPTVRSFDISNPLKPVLTSVAHMPENPREFTNTGHENIGIMENAKTYGSAKGAFAASMCGGGVLFTPDITKLKGDSSKQWVQVWDDGLSEIFTDQRDAQGVDGSQVEEPGGCAGGAWHQVTKNNKWFYRAIQGRVPLSTNFYDQGAHKMIYNINIEALMKSAEDGKVDCDLTNGIDLNGDGAIDHGNRETGMDIFRRLAEGEKVADCPSYNSSLVVDDRTTGGPHWAALDNNTLANDGNPTRMVFSDYFVARTGVDGNHRMYVVNVDPKTQKLSYDKKFRDEKTGAIGVDFNRRNWPNSPDAGFYKPHSMLWICPPGLCEEYKPGTEVATKKTKKKHCTKAHIKSKHRGKSKNCSRPHKHAKHCTAKHIKSKHKGSKKACSRKHKHARR